jgi:alpha-beta hydrolase superfamily lysophospholipase
MLSLYDNNNLEKISKDLPIIILSGEQDTVGNFGKDIERFYESYKQLNIKDISYKLYEDDRHEILNELDREIVYNDIGKWILNRI